MTCMNFTIGDSDKISQEKPTLHAIKKSINDSRKSESEQKYGAGVLLGNWFDRRAEYTCSFNEWQTTHKSVYKSYGSEFLKNDRSVVWDRKIEDEGLGARFIIGHYDEEYLNNMTTSCDIFHRIIPQKIPRSRIFKIKRNEWLPQQDLLQNFGNSTEYGLIKDKQYEMMALEERSRPWSTTYQFSFKKSQGSPNLWEKRYVKPRPDFNQVNLDHLGIDLNSRLVAHKSQEKLPYKPQRVIQELGTQKT